jgi:hypothetical protein
MGGNKPGLVAYPGMDLEAITPRISHPEGRSMGLARLGRGREGGTDGGRDGGKQDVEEGGQGRVLQCSEVFCMVQCSEMSAMALSVWTAGFS